jgi:hypothetical protein
MDFHRKSRDDSKRNDQKQVVSGHRSFTSIAAAGTFWIGRPRDPAKT